MDRILFKPMVTFHTIAMYLSHAPISIHYHAQVMNVTPEYAMNGSTRPIPIAVFCLFFLATFGATFSLAQSPGVKGRTILPMAKDLGGGYFRLLEVYEDGTLVRRPVPHLRRVRFLSLELASTSEMARGQRNRSLIDPFEDFAEGIFLKDGSRIYHVSGNTGQGFVRVTPFGRFRVLAWTSQASGFCDRVAISDHDPYLAVVSHTPLPEYGGANLVCIRTDGARIPNANKRAIGILTPMGNDVESESLAFLKGALFANDGDGLHRLDLTTMVMSQVPFPTSNGMIPVYYDLTCAVAANGGSLAIGAGQSPIFHDVYTVDAAGNAVNQTQWAAPYSAALNHDSEGMLMALSPDGERLAYVLDYFYPFAYTMDVLQYRATEMFTGVDYFPCFIDTIVGLGFATKETVVFSAGSSFSRLDAYSLKRGFAQAPVNGAPLVVPAGTMQNLTKTSSTPLGPFLIDSNLELKRRFTVGPNTFLTHEDINGNVDLQVVNEDGASLGIVSEGVEAIVPLEGMVVIVDETADDHLRIQAWNTRGSAFVACSFVGGDDEELIAKSVSPDGKNACFLMELNGIQRFVILDCDGQTKVHALPNGWTGDGVMFSQTGCLLLTGKRSNQTEVLTFDCGPEARWIGSTIIPAPLILIP